MKRFVCALVLAATTFHAMAVSSFLAGLSDKYIALGGLLTTTTTSVQAGFLAGLVVFASNGEAQINLRSQAAVEALEVAVEKAVAGEALSDEDQAILTIYANAKHISVAQVIAQVSAEL